MTEFVIGCTIVGLVYFLPPAKSVFPQRPECSISEFSPDVSQKQKQLCREARSKK